MLSRFEMKSWQQNGFVLIKKCIPPGLVAAAEEAIWDCLKMDRENPEEWCTPELRDISGIDERGMIPLYHQQALWDCRQYPKLYQAFREIWQTKKLLVSVDRVNMNPPVCESWKYSGFIHWDIDVSTRPLPFQVQGLLALSETGQQGGGFQCVSGFHKIIDDWLDRQPAGYSSRFPDTEGMQLISIPMEAGDFLIWHGALPHGNSANLSDQPRLAQYISMFPESHLDEISKKKRIESSKTGAAPKSNQGTQLPLTRSGNAASSVTLSKLGRRLLGIDSY